MKLIFLDLNGVIDSVESMLATDKCLGETNRFDPIAIGLIKRLCKETGAKIVITSTKRKITSQHSMIEIISKYNWPDFFHYFVGYTPVFSDNERGEEIAACLKELQAKSTKEIQYIIVDDDSEDYVTPEQISRYLHVSNTSGFGIIHYCKALRMFGMPDERLENQITFKRTTNKGLQPLPFE